MKNSKLFFAFLVMIFGTVQAFSQYKFEGRVVDVTDGKTVVIDVGQSKRMVAELQDIEVPEPEQELYQTVVDHLRKLLLGKQVRFYPGGWTLPKIKGQLVADGVDVSQQMLRDGAAWYAPGGSLDNAYVYRNSEAQAKAENRGVWSVKTLKPAWEFRQEKAEKAALLKKQQEEDARKAQLEEEKAVKAKYALSERNGKVSAAPISQKMGIEDWDFDPTPKSNLDLIYRYNAPTNQTGVSTPPMMTEVYDGKNKHQVLFLAGYRSEGETVQKGGRFRIVVGDVSSQKNFLRSNGVTIFIGKNKKLNIGKAEVFVNDKVEMLAYNVSRSALEQIAASSEPVLQIGQHRKILDKSVLNVVRKILDATE